MQRLLATVAGAVGLSSMTTAAVGAGVSGATAATGLTMHLLSSEKGLAKKVNAFKQALVESKNTNALVAEEQGDLFDEDSASSKEHP